MTARLPWGVSAVAIVAGLSFQPAMAQDSTAPKTATDQPQAQGQAPVPQSTPAANSPNGAAVPPASPEQEAGLGEIVVTAQHVTESSQRAPIALDVISPEELVRQNVIRAEDLSRTSNALSATGSTGGPTTVFFVRGVGNATVNAYSDPAIAFNYDGVYIGRPELDLGRVLRPAAGRNPQRPARHALRPQRHGRRDQRDPQPPEAGRNLGSNSRSATAITTG